jgi:uncharacterized protein YraI
MRRRLVFVIAAGLAVTGCLGGSCYIQSSASTMAGWDELDPLPKRVDGKTAKVRKTSEPVSDDTSPSEAELAALKPYSKEWWSVREAIDRVADVKLAEKLIICRGCLSSEPDDQTGSITPR